MRSDGGPGQGDGRAQGDEPLDDARRAAQAADFQVQAAFKKDYRNSERDEVGDSPFSVMAKDWFCFIATAGVGNV